MFSLISHSMCTASRPYSTSAVAVHATPKRIGAVRGGLTGFLLGVTVTGIGCYYYLLDEYKRSNNVLVLDLMSLAETVKNLEEHIKSLDSKK